MAWQVPSPSVQTTLQTSLLQSWHEGCAANVLIAMHAHLTGFVIEVRHIQVLKLDEQMDPVHNKHAQGKRSQA